MVRQERKIYSKGFKDQVVTAYRMGNDSLSLVAKRFGLKYFTLHHWVYGNYRSSPSPKSAILAPSNLVSVKEENLSPEAMEALIKELKHELSLEKIRSESLSKMIEIAEREYKISIRKKFGAKQSLK